MARKHKLQTKIILITIAAVAVVLITVSYIDSYWVYQLAEENRYGHYIDQTRLLALRIRDGGMLEHPTELAREIRSVKNNSAARNILQIDVLAHTDSGSQLIATTANDGNIMPEADKLGPDKLPPGYSDFYQADQDVYTIENHPSNGPESWIFTAEINNGSAVIGCLNLKGTRDLEYQYLNYLRLKTILTVFGSIAGLMAVLTVMFWWFFRRPMKALIAAMAQAETGNLAAQANVYGEDEIGTLASNFNRMLTKIRYASEENQNLLSQIKDFNEELSQKVLSATAELADKNRELRHANQALFETQRSLATSERQALAGQMAASLAHEIGTPLNAISGHVQLIAKTLPQDEKTQRRLKIISSQIEQITATVKDLLVATRQLRITMRPLDINSLIQETLALTEPVLDSRGILVKSELAENLPLVLGDGDRLRQVLLNLINNSIDAMPHGGRLMLRSSMNSINDDNQQVLVEIRDTGCGIEPEDLDRIFEPMFTTKRIGEGVGLGLAICRETIEEHDGRITARSESQYGTTFTIELPAHQTESESAKTAVEVISN